MLTLKIPVQNIEATRQIVLKHKIIDYDYKIKVENGFGHIPIKKETEEDILLKVMEECKKEVSKQNNNYSIEIIDLKDERIIDYRENPLDLIDYISRSGSYAPHSKIYDAHIIRENKLRYDENLKCSEDTLFIRQ